jgi:CheY-like chemotaxis protein
VSILGADDDATSRRIVQLALETLRHECRTVNDGDEAWEELRSRNRVEQAVAQPV